MEGIFEVLLQILVEIVFEIIGEIVGGAFEYIFSTEFWDYLNRKSPITPSFSNEIITLNIQGYNKEKFTK